LLFELCVNPDEEYDAGEREQMVGYIEEFLNEVDFDSPKARAHVTRDILTRMGNNRAIRSAYRRIFEKKPQVLDAIRHQMSTVLEILANHFAKGKINQESIVTLVDVVARDDRIAEVVKCRNRHIRAILMAMSSHVYDLQLFYKTIGTDHP
jgi:hypothetical protein